MAEWNVVSEQSAPGPWDVAGEIPVREPDMQAVRDQVSGNIARAMAKKPKQAESFIEALEAGLEMSVSGLAVRGESPSVGIGADSPMLHRVGAMSTQVLGDMPAMVAGGLIGGGAGTPTGPGAAVTAVAGAFALPAGLRAVMMDSYEKGEFQSFGDFWDRTMGILWDTSKAWVVGAATAGAGILAKPLAAAMPQVVPTVVRAAVPTTAEIATMVTVGSAFEGHVPTAQDFVDAAIVLGGIKAAGHVGGRLRDIYARTGVKPEQVVKDATEHPEVWQELVGGEGQIPKVYEHLRQNGPRQEPIATKPAEKLLAKSGEATPRLTEQQATTAIAFQQRPLAKVPQMPGEPALPNHLNYNYIETPEQVKMSLARLSDLYESQITKQRRGTVGWKQTFDESAKVLGDLVSAKPEEIAKFINRDPGTPAGAAELYARKELAVSAAELLMQKRASLVEKGPNASAQEVADFLVQVERTGEMTASFLGARAETGRALNILKNTQREGKGAEAIGRILQEYGGQGRVQELVEKLGQFTDAKQVLKFSQEAVKATTWEKLMEAWKAGLVSGFRTHEVNMLSNSVFAGLRVPVRAVAAAYGKLHGGEKVALVESVGQSVGLLKGVWNGLKVAAAEIRTAGKDIADTAKSQEMGAGAKSKEILRTAIGSKKEVSDVPKVEQYRPAIEGTLGEVVRTPFRMLSAEDALFREMNRSGELYAQATRQAINEGVPLFSKRFSERVAQIADTPTPEMVKAAETAAERFTFNTPLGPKGQSFQNFVRTNHLEWIFPFIRTPGNIFKEVSRMTPGLNLAVAEWRADFMKGGVARDLALAEVTVGAALSAAVVAAVNAGVITGGGTPEKNQRSSQRAAGWKPYAVKVGDAYYDGYLRMAPVGVLIGVSADGAEFWNYMTQDEHDKWARMMAYAFAQNVTNQTFMRGFTSIVNVTQDPERYGESYFEQLAGSAIPSAVAQFGQETDPYIREVHGMAEALRARIPYMREGLMPKRDIFGEQIKSPQALWWGSPFTVSEISKDKVRAQAAAIGFAAPTLPKKVDVIPGMDVGKLDKVELTPEQRDVFASESGRMAHAALEPIVNSPAWDDIPLILRRQIYERTFAEARRFAAMKALSPSEREDAIETSIEKFRKELQKK